LCLYTIAHVEKRKFNKLIKQSQLNDNHSGVLENVYDNDLPHPYFNPEKIGFYNYRLFQPDRYSIRSALPNKSIVFHDSEQYLPGTKEFNIVGNSPLTEKDYIITSCITDNDHRYPVPYVFNSWHLVQTREANKNYHALHPVNRPFFADVLLGNTKPDRDIFFNLLKKQGLLEKCIVNYFNQYKSIFLKNSKEPVNKNIDNTNDVSNVKTATNTQNFFTSQLISEEIYENSWFTIAAESLCRNDIFFPTEKIGKPMLANRPFIVLSGKHYLKKLKSLGFITFHPFIDETYDDIDDKETRIKSAFNSFTECMSQDPFEFRKKIAPILDHNEALMRNKADLTKQARQFLDDIRSKL